MKRTTFSRMLLMAFVTLVLPLQTPAAGIDPVNKNKAGLAIRGYDPVSYFTNGKPVPGDESYSVVWMGATWLFANESHKTTFEKNPQRYAPQYGGYCAWAVGHNYTADGDPHAWAIVDDKLYLNYNKSVREMWKKDQDALIRKGDKNWPELLKK